MNDQEMYRILARASLREMYQNGLAFVGVPTEELERRRANLERLVEAPAPEPCGGRSRTYQPWWKR